MMGTEQMRDIFVSYRRSDSSDVTGRIFDRLKARFGEDCLFKDVDSIPLGTDFREVISDAVGKCSVLLAVIGDDWLVVTDHQGRRRLDDSNDYVQIEIATALQRHIPVVPVLVEKASMPRPEELPQPIQDLAFRNGIQVRPDPDFHNDIDRLCKQIAGYIADRKPISRRTRWILSGTIMTVVVVAIVVAAILHQSQPHQKAEVIRGPGAKTTESAPEGTTTRSTITAKDRLQIPKEFLPLVDDKSIAFHRRCLALAECINAEIFLDEVAFEKTAQLVYQSPRINEVPDSLAEERLAFPPLVQALSPLVASNIENVIRHYYDAEASIRFGQPDRSTQAGFWWSVFQDALRTRTDECLVALAETKTLLDKYEQWNNLCVNLPDDIVRKMAGAPSPGIQAIAALQYLRRENADPEHVTAVSKVKTLLTVESDDDLLLAARILSELRRPPVGVVEPVLATVALDIVLHDGPNVGKSLELPSEKHRSPRAERFDAASEYLKYAAEFSQVADVVTDRLVISVRDYESTLQAMETRLPDRGNGDLTARACIEALITVNYASPKRLVPAKERLPPTAYEALSLVFGHSEKLLTLVNLKHLRSKWQAALDGKGLND
jgi:hypothetical protein